MMKRRDRIRRFMGLLMALVLTLSTALALAQPAEEVDADALLEEANGIAQTINALIDEQTTFAYQGEEYLLEDGLDTANSLFWETDDYFPFCDALLAASLEKSTAVAELFLRQVDLLNRYAALSGFANYVDYARDLYGMDYTAREVYDIISFHYPRTIRLIVGTGDYVSYAEGYAFLDREEYIDFAIEAYGAISPDFAQSLRTLVQSDRFVLDSDGLDAGVLGRVALVSGVFENVAIAEQDDVRFMGTLIHEFGHYLHTIATSKRNTDWNLAIDETCSLGGAMLCEEAVRQYVEERLDAETAALLMLNYFFNQIGLMHNGIMSNMLLEDIFARPEEYEPEDVAEQYFELTTGLGFDAGLSENYRMLTGTEWYQYSSQFTTPIYSLSYVIGAVNALCLMYRQAVDQSGEAIYVGIINNPTTAGTYSEYCSSVGFFDFFDPATHEGVDAFIAEKYNALYDILFADGEE